jgi:hypothetical protein
MTIAVVANGKFLEGEFLAAPNTDVSDGCLDMIVMKRSKF